MTQALTLSLTTESLRDVLQLAGYRVETLRDEKGVVQLRSATNGISFLARFGNLLAGANDAYVDAVFTAALQLARALPPGALNQWNASRRFARLHGNDNLIALEMDLSVVGGVTNDHVRAMIEIWDRMIQELLAYLRTVLLPNANANGQAAEVPRMPPGPVTSESRPVASPAT